MAVLTATVRVLEGGEIMKSMRQKLKKDSCHFCSHSVCQSHTAKLDCCGGNMYFEQYMIL